MEETLHLQLLAITLDICPLTHLLLAGTSYNLACTNGNTDHYVGMFLAATLLLLVLLADTTTKADTRLRLALRLGMVPQAALPPSRRGLVLTETDTHLRLALPLGRMVAMLLSVRDLRLDFLNLVASI